MAVKLLTGTTREVDVAGIVKAVMVGWETSGKVITTWSLLLVETLPAASLVQA